MNKIDTSYKEVILFVFYHWCTKPKHTLFLVSLAILSSFSDILMPLMAANFTKELLSDGSVYEAFILITVVGLLGIILRQRLSINLARYTLLMMDELGRGAFQRVQAFTSDWHASGFSGTTVRKITRGMWALVSLNDTVFVGLIPIVVMLVGSTVTVWLHWPIVGTALGVIALLFCCVTALLTIAYVAPVAKVGNASDSRLSGVLSDSLSCNSVVKAFAAEQREEQRLSTAMESWKRLTFESWRRSNINGGVQEGLLLLLQTTIFGLLIWLSASGALSMTDITFLITTLFMLQGYLRRVGSNIRHLQRAVSELEAMVEFSNLPIESGQLSEGSQVIHCQGDIVFKRVNFGYLKEPTALLFRNLNLHIKAGERVGLVGYSGSGKSTFIKLIQRLYQVNSGCIMLDGNDINTLDLQSLRSQIALVPQEPILFHRTLAENIAYSKPEASQESVQAAAEFAGIHQRICSLPDGYSTLVGERGVKLSGGERQRVAIARAFLLDAPILILDEATSSLDSESEMHIQQSMEKLMEGRTTLIVAHRLSTIQSMDRILVFDKGEIVEQGTHKQLISNSGLYSRLCQSQVQKNTQYRNT
ncbi:ABC transporter ATP-binding protein [Vibrio pectenicida]|uniref:ABC transporter ATP-binding protein n=1 Tax=Vibrio pectenicida TaxID=62763 RepID=A0A427TYS9_9VIBR|nr:ABC transporter ATP-binding protein [Vibrio pectenicida]NOH71652.1 ABC transporter ATP-binding protein [Vibrio pectenicida]RSD29623.1 ABC transporter ATP-binding protein [Vibrio pectenicida]